MSSWDERTLEEMLRRELGDHDITVPHLERLTGGSSREIWALTMKRGGGSRELVLRCDPPGERRDDGAAMEAAVMTAARRAGVPVPEVVAVASGDVDGLFLERVDGETVGSRVLADPGLSEARARLARACGRALGALHSTPAPPGLIVIDRVAEYRAVLDELGQARPVLEFVHRWLVDRPPADRPAVLTHGDFRLGNLVVDQEGLRAVLDWESAHLASPLEDLGWLCVPAWRFGCPLPVGGFGTVDDLLAGYVEGGGSADISPSDLHWAVVAGTWVWAVGCLQQAERHRSGATRSVDLAAVGRQVVANEADLLTLVTPDVLPSRSGLVEEERALPETLAFGPPTLTELLDAVAGTLEHDLLPGAVGRDRYLLRVCRNVLAMTIRELLTGAVVARSADDLALCEAVRAAPGEVPVDIVRALVERTADLLDVVDPRRAAAFRGRQSSDQ